MSICNDPAMALILNYVKNIIIIIQIVVPIILLLMISVELTKMINNPDDKKGIKRMKNSIIALVVVFFIPTLINIVMGLVGENSKFSSCWVDRDDVKNKKVEYILVEENDYKKILVDASYYEKGDEKKTLGIYGLTNSGGVDEVTGAQLVAVAKTQLGVKYHSMHYGPKGSGDEGFGCAMFVAYCYNNVFFGGARGDFQLDGKPRSAFYGATTLFWPTEERAGRHFNHGFVEVDKSEAMPGDVVAYTHYDAKEGKYKCGHVALYTGNGKIMEAGGRDEHSFDMNSNTIHILHYVGNGGYW